MTLAEQIKQVMEWDAGDYHELDNCYEAVSIIRQLTDIIKQQHEALNYTCGKVITLFSMECTPRQVYELEKIKRECEQKFALSAPIVKGVV